MGLITIRSINNNRIYIILFCIVFLFFFYINFPRSFSSSDRYGHETRQWKIFPTFNSHNKEAEAESVHRHGDGHQHINAPSSVISMTPKRTPYPKRLNMGECPKIFGKVTVFVAVVESSYKTHYRVAQRSLECYLKSVDYEFKLVDLDHDPKVKKHCKHDQLFFKKHCAASVYLEETDWMLVLDADAGVVNPNHCIEEWIDDRVDIIFYERFFNWEIASGNYLVKNTPFAKDFLRRWADWQFIQPSNWNGADNGVLQIHILQTVMPNAKAEIRACDSIWHRGKDYDTYMAYVTCVKVMLGANRFWPRKLRIYRRAHGWVRDGYLTTDGWSENDFMLHGWKAQDVDLGGWQSPFNKILNASECSTDYSGWDWRTNKRLSVDEVRKQLANFEKGSGRNFPKQAQGLPYLTEPDIGECFPHCDDDT